MHLPNKLKKDAILEAICEFRFESDEMDELVLGRLSENVPWEGFSRVRLPLSDVPAPIRKNDPGLKFQPVVELRDRTSTRVVKIGSNVVSAHVMAPYCGWAAFRPRLHEVLDVLFKKFTEVRVTRIGLRYVNALGRKDHHVDEINGLRLKIKIDSERLTVPFSLAYMQASEDITSIIKVASPSLVTGINLPSDFVALIDVDVFTPDSFVISDCDTGKNWIDRAHQTEKEEFFRLWTEEALTAATEE
jgi:uncharacterized protein (TIGR04255 family)